MRGRLRIKECIISDQCSHSPKVRGLASCQRLRGPVVSVANHYEVYLLDR